MICSKCMKNRVIFYYDMCQTCYKESNKEIKNKEKNNVYRMNNANVKRVLELYESGVSRKDIANVYNITSYRNVCIIIRKYIKVV